MLNTLHVPHVNSVLNQVHGTSPLNRSMSAKILNSPGIAIKREVLTPVSMIIENHIIYLFFLNISVQGGKVHEVIPKV